jgi:hypothetical protein
MMSWPYSTETECKPWLTVRKGTTYDPVAADLSDRH